MIALVLEASSSEPSLGIWREDRLVASRTWALARRQPSPLFDLAEAALAEADTPLADLTHLVVGRGPGNYSGLRIALCAAQGLGLPGGIPLYTVSSPEALAVAQLHAQPDTDSVGVIGDARRGCIWAGAFHRSPDGPPGQTLDWQLIPYAEAPERLAATASRWISPDADRLGDLGDALGSTRWQGLAVPTAQDVGSLAADRLQRGLASDAPTPYYLHPAVAE